MDEGVIERGENTGNTENESACKAPIPSIYTSLYTPVAAARSAIRKAQHTISGQRSKRDVLGAASGSLLGRHGDGM